MAGGFDFTTGGVASLTKYNRIVERSIDNGSSFQALPDIPYGSGYGMAFACLVIIDDNTVFLAGGRMGKLLSRGFITSHINSKKGAEANKIFLFVGPEYYADTYFLDLTSNVWTPGPTMSYKRNFPTCSLITQQSGQKEIVIVGGQDTARDNHCMIQREVEILNLDTNTLRNGEQKFPKVKLSILQLTLYI